MNKGPVSVTILGWVYILVGVAGGVSHLAGFKSGGAFPYDLLWAELTEAVAIVCGVFLLRGQNWARWLAVAWIGFHVALSAFHAIPELAVHCVFCAVIVWVLFRREAARYFRARA